MSKEKEFELFGDYIDCSEDAAPILGADYEKAMEKCKDLTLEKVEEMLFSAEGEYEEVKDEVEYTELEGFPIDENDNVTPKMKQALIELEFVMDELKYVISQKKKETV